MSVRPPAGGGPGLLTEEVATATYGKALNLDTYAGVDPTGVTECAAAIQAAIDAAAAAGVPLVSADAEYKIATGITLVDHADLSRARVSFTGTAGAAITVGSDDPLQAPSRKTIRLPYVIASAKTNLGWAQLAADAVGVAVLNMTNCEVYFPCVRNFVTGIQFEGVGVGGGVTYSKFHLGQLINNKRNVVITASDGGYANQNQTFGGNFNFDAAEGVAVFGCRHILIEDVPAAVDGWTFHQASLEDSGGVAEATIECWGNNNLWDHCRYETAVGSPSVRWRDGSYANEIRGGVNVDAIVESTSGTTANTIVRAPGRKVLTASKTLDNTDEGKVIVSNAGAPVTYSLPTVASRSPGTRVTIQNVAASTVTVNTTTDPLDGGFTATIAQWESKTFVSQQTPDTRWLTLAAS